METNLPTSSKANIPPQSPPSQTLEEALVEVSQVFASSNAPDLNVVLRLIGQAIGVSRAYIFLFKENCTKVDNTHEWCAESTTSGLTELQNLDTGQITWWMQKLKTEKVIMIGDETMLPPEAVVEKSVMRTYQIRSLLAMPIWLANSSEIFGFIGFNDSGQPRTWSGQEVRLLQVVRDMISSYFARNQAEEATSQMMQRYQDLFEAAPVMYVITCTTESGPIIVNCNRAFLQTLGYHRSEVLGRPLEVFYSTDSQAKLMADDEEEQFMTGQTNRPEHRLLTKDGRVIETLLQAVPEIDVNGQVFGTRATYIDITERRQAESEIARLYQAEQAHHREAEALWQTAMALISTLDLNQVIKRLLVELKRVIPYDSASVQLLKDDRFEIIGGHGFVNTGELIGYRYSLRVDTPNWRVLQTKAPVILDDVATEAGFVRGPRAAKEIHGWLGVPLMLGEQAIGMLTLDKSQPCFYTATHARLAGAYAAQAAIAIENARLYSELGRRVNELHVMNTISQVITSSLNLSEILSLITDRVTQLLEATLTIVVLWDDIEGSLRVAAASGGILERVQGWRLEREPGIVDRVIQTGQPALVPDVTQEPDLQHYFLRKIGVVVHSILCAPMQAKGQIIGAIEVIYKEKGYFDDHDLELLSLMAASAAAAIENARLYEQAQQEILERKQTEIALQEERASLAKRVAERTAELSAANAELTRAARLKDEFLASMSHELRTPLNAILGLSEGLQEQVYGSLNERQLKYLRTIEESGRHLLALINDILDLSKIEAGKMSLEFGIVQLELLCQACLRLIRETAHKKQLQISLNYDQAVTTIWADERRLKQILVNLLSNAVKFTPSGGSIGLEVTGDTERQVVNLTVWDTGIGIAPEDMEQLFKPFVQVDSRLSRQYEGAGLGLSLVARLSEMHNGGVTVQSTVGGGSRFTVTLPWLPQTELQQFKSQLVEQPLLVNRGQSRLNHYHHHASSPLILLAEDNESNITTLSDYLHSHKYRLTVARNGTEALELVRVELPDLILMDVQMPGLDGLETTRRLRLDPTFQRVPIIALTALAMPGDRERCLAAGVNDYLAKPINLKQLVMMIESYLNMPPQ